MQSVLLAVCCYALICANKMAVVLATTAFVPFMQTSTCVTSSLCILPTILSLFIYFFFCYKPQEKLQIISPVVCHFLNSVF